MLAYGTEALLPVEIGVHTLRVRNFKPDNNERLLANALDLRDELRENALLRAEAAKQRLIRKFSRKVKARAFLSGDLVLRRTDATSRGVDQGKFTPNWEGPLKVTRVVGPSTYELEDLDGGRLPRFWSAYDLKRYFA